MGRTSKYSDELASEICQLMTEGMSLNRICQLDRMPARQTICVWLADERYSSFRDKYIRAREALADYYIDKGLEAAFDDSGDTAETEEKVFFLPGNVNRSRLKADYAFKYAEKIAPRKYGAQILNKIADHEGNALSPIFAKVIETIQNGEK